MKTFIEFITEEGEGGVPANNVAATPGIEKYDPLLGGKKKIKARRSPPQIAGSIIRIPGTPSHG